MSELLLKQPIDSGRRDPQVIELQVDEHGSPVTIEPRVWFMCFVPGLKKQRWHPFVNKRHKHVFAMRPAEAGKWTLFEPWWQRLLTATISTAAARKFLIWSARGDVLSVREAVPGQGSQVRGWMTCAALASYLLGRPYWVWTPHGLYKLLLRESDVCRVDVTALITFDDAKLDDASLAIVGCDACAPGAPKPFCMECGRDDVIRDRSASQYSWRGTCAIPGRAAQGASFCVRLHQPLAAGAANFRTGRFCGGRVRLRSGRMELRRLRGTHDVGHSPRTPGLGPLPPRLPERRDAAGRGRARRSIYKEGAARTG
jgi:hypothetical protein